MLRNVDVCPMLFTVGMIDILPDSIVAEIINMSNATVIQSIESFITKFNLYEDEVIKRVIAKLRRALKSYYEYQAFVNSKELADAFTLIVSQNKANISYDMDKSELNRIKDVCRNVLQYEDKLKRYDEESFNKHLSNISELAKSESSDVRAVATDLVNRLKKCKKIFVNVRGREDDKTILYKIFKFKDKAIQLAEAAEGCLMRMDTKENNVPFDKRLWRHI